MSLRFRVINRIRYVNSKHFVFMGLPGELPELEHLLLHRGKVRNIYTADFRNDAKPLLTSTRLRHWRTTSVRAKF